jgi:hypothetical protein
LKAAKFRIKSFKVYTSPTGDLWKFIMSTGIKADLASSIVPADILKAKKIVLKSVQPLSGKGHTNIMNG